MSAGWITLELDLFEALVDALEAIHDENRYRDPCVCGLDERITEARRVLSEAKS